MQWLMGGRYENGMDTALRTDFDEEIKNGINAWEDDLKQAGREPDVLMVQDHCFNSAPPGTVLHILELISNGDAGPETGENVVRLPEHLLLQPGLIPLFTMRDPRLAVPSAYRVLKEFGLPRNGDGSANFSITTNPIWIRLLYSWYIAHGIEPVVVDCDDVQTAAGTDFLQRLAARLGLEPGKLCLSWAQIGDEARAAAHPSFYASQRTLLESSGLNAELAAKGRDWGKEEERWAEEFGEDFEVVKEMIESARTHYQWLLERKFE